jgi:purine-binding chemotaxis protein CheW
MQPAAAAEAPDAVQLCAFYVGGDEYVVDIMRVEEILLPQRVTAVPRAPPFVEGVVNLRGVIVPVIRLARRLEPKGPPPPRAKPKLLVCWVGRRRVGLMVDGVSEVMRVNRSAIKPAPSIATPGADPLVIGVCGPPDRLRLLLDVKALLAEPR